MRVAAVIGSPIEQSLSPTIHNAAFRTHGDDWVFVAFHVAAGHASQAVESMRTLEIGGLAVTMPLKTEVCDALDVLEDSAKLAHSVNTVIRQADGSLLGANTDGEGCCNALESAGAVLASAKVAVLGAGGTARAIIGALSLRGIAEVAVINRTKRNAQHAIEVSPLALIGDESDIAKANIVINATPLGMVGTDPAELPCDVKFLSRGQFVLDAVYRPLATPWLRGARQVGATTVDGIDMLVHQGALQQFRWLGRLPSVEIMRTAALERINSRSAEHAPIA